MDHYKHITIDERETIFLMRNHGNSLREIASHIKKSYSTISRELSRNSTGKSYSPSKAQEKYKQRKGNCGRVSLLSNPQVFEVVREHFCEDLWSPEKISNRLAVEKYPVQISTTTIYRGIFNGLFDNLFKSGSSSAVRHLRHHGKSRHNKAYQEKRGKIPIPNKIHDRPREADNRVEIGHWEGDTVLGKSGKACVVTLVDRKSRYLLIGKAAKRISEAVTDTLSDLMKLWPGRSLTITPDRGKESAKVQCLTDKFGTPFYFPDPHSPWQRGTNENTNGLLREYLPKGTDLDSITDRRIQAYAEQMNNRPRKCLGWKTPYEIFFNVVLHLI
ncbi:IS30 family transposase [Lentilactobacillus kefiri]|uniref:IS30 family transposase n=1 Tax=Lentilactobacillus kefiri TaxID=33962 RepID=UPI00345E27AF